jgi:hypothetical protein
VSSDTVWSLQLAPSLNKTFPEDRTASSVFKHNQQDAALHNGIYYYKCSTSFMRFLRPSSGSQNCIHRFGYLSSFFCFLPLSWVSWNWFACAVGSVWKRVPTHSR